MRARFALITILITAMTSPSVRGHVETERYIPMGQSPGLAGTTAYGVVEPGSDAQQGLLVKGHRYHVDPTTHIWLDRTGMSLTNQTGSYTDCQPGRTVEIRFREHDGEFFADWVKVRVEKKSVASRSSGSHLS